MGQLNCPYCDIYVEGGIAEGSLSMKAILYKHIEEEHPEQAEAYKAEVVGPPQEAPCPLDKWFEDQRRFDAQTERQLKKQVQAMEDQGYRWSFDNERWEDEDGNEVE